jgi:hypothetical protein
MRQSCDFIRAKAKAGLEKVSWDNGESRRGSSPRWRPQGNGRPCQGSLICRRPSQQWTLVAPSFMGHANNFKY